MSNGLVRLTLEGLYKRLEDDKLTVQMEEGFVKEMSFEFYQPISEQELQDFISCTQIQLPVDYFEFLRLHNGARLFDIMFLFKLKEVQNKVGIIGYFPENWYPIGSGYDGQYLIIDMEKVRKGENDYLIWWGSSIIDDAMYLNLNFELWLDRFIIAQGTQFWLWPIYNSKNYYR